MHSASTKRNNAYQRLERSEEAGCCMLTFQDALKRFLVLRHGFKRFLIAGMMSIWSNRMKSGRGVISS